MNINVGKVGKVNPEVEVGDLVQIDFTCLGTKFFIITKRAGKHFLQGISGENYAFESANCNTLGELVIDILNYGSPSKFYPKSEYEFNLVKREV